MPKDAHPRVARVSILPKASATAAIDPALPLNLKTPNALGTVPVETAARPMSALPRKPLYFSGDESDDAVSDASAVISARRTPRVVGCHEPPAASRRIVLCHRCGALPRELSAARRFAPVQLDVSVQPIATDIASLSRRPDGPARSSCVARRA